MEIQDQQTRDAATEVATILATAYQRYRRARHIEIAADDASETVKGELAVGAPKSLHSHEVDA